MGINISTVLVGLVNSLDGHTKYSKTTFIKLKHAQEW